MFEFVALRTLADLPSRSDRVIDVALLDMNHEAHNIGRDAIVRALREFSTILEPQLREAGRSLRVIAFDVRAAGLVPRDDRFELYIGTGGPGHPDPRENRGRSESEIVENTAWEVPLFRLFDAIASNADAAFVGVCHSFGLLSRWAGIAAPRLRRSDKGGPSVGICDNVLTDAAAGHPWFGKLVASIGRRVPVVDSRHYDLMPQRVELPSGMTAIGHDTGVGDRAALTMVEFARNPDDDVPRIFASNHHPEIPDSASLRDMLEYKRASGEVTSEWYESRALLLEMLENGVHLERERLLTSSFTFRRLVQTHLERLIGRDASVHGSAIPSAL